MPELPEVETIRGPAQPRSSWGACSGASRSSTRAGRDPLAPEQLSDALEGRRIERLGRRGKYLVWSLEGDVHLAQHLRIDGRRPV